MRCGRSADGDGLVLELFKYDPPYLYISLVYIYNDIFCTGQLNLSWQHTLFTMVPKSGDLQQTKNWRPIAIIKTTYKMFAKILHDRLQPLLETKKWIKLVFDEALVLTTRWLSLKLFAVKALNKVPKFVLQVWI